jgi:hypothetical protein
MAQVEAGLGSALEVLARRVQELEERVASLEGRTHRTAAAESPKTGALPGELAHAAAHWQGLPTAEVSGGIFSTLGKAVLGMAGAFLLRAIAESGSVPQLPVLVVGIVYAILWMVWAARIHRRDEFASLTYAVTSALILSPMLSECTLRFRALSAAMAAVVLVAFVLAALALAWRQQLLFIPVVATLVSVITALVLLFGTRDLAPITTALLAIALTTEAAVCVGHRLSLRALPALAADLALWLLIYVMTSPEGVPQGYHAVSAAAIAALSLGLLAVYGSSIAVRGFASRRPITVFDIIQIAIAAALAVFGTVRASHSAAAALGVVFLLLAAGGYWGALFRFTDQSYARNRRISATWAAALLLAGSCLLFSVQLRIAILCVAAAAAAFIYTRTEKFTLGLHASAYLAAATAFSPLPAYAADALAGAVPAAPHWSIWAVAACAALCYMIGSRGAKDRGARRLLWVLPPALASFAAAALLVAALAALFAPHVELSASRLSVIRTSVICALALLLGLFASRWKRAELGWLAYAAVAFGSLKLVVEDLRIGNAGTLVFSLLFYGLILILLPRFLRRLRTEP